VSAFAQALAGASLTGAALAAAFPRLDVWPAAWVALVPLLLVTRALSPGRAVLAGWWAGVVWFGGTLSWVPGTLLEHTGMGAGLVAMVFAGMLAILGAYVGVFAGGVRWLARGGVSPIVAAPALWVVLEWARGSGPLGFSWAMLGSSQYGVAPLVQMAEVTGVYGISALLVLANVVLCGICTQPRAGTAWRQVALLVTGVGVLLAVGQWRIGQVRAARATRALRVALIQPNLPQHVKWRAAGWRAGLDRHARLTRASLAGSPDLVVWPETTVPFMLNEPGERSQAVVRVAAEARRPLVLGAPGYRFEEPSGQTNRVHLVTPEGISGLAYDKMRLVPFGERIPFATLLPFVRPIVPSTASLAAGVTPTVFTVPQTRFGVLICYEATSPEQAALVVRAGAQLLLNLTNDGWFGDTAAPYQHLAQATLRAVENRVPVVRVANTGISAVITPDGAIDWQGPLFEEAWHVAAVSWRPTRTVYTRFGDVFVALCGLAVAACFGWGWCLAHRRKSGR
jgi:apolipoprotein N-acyltransferase